MRVVTLYAVSFRDHFMRTYRAVRQDLAVAFEAYPVRICRQQLTVRRRMGAMAAGAVSGFDRCMDIKTFQFLLKIGMAGDADLSLSPGLQFEFLLRISL